MFLFESNEAKIAKIKIIKFLRINFILKQIIGLNL